MLSKYQSLVNLLNPKKEEIMTPIIQPEPETNMSLPPAEPEPSEAMSKMSQEQMDELNKTNEQQVQQPEIPDNTPIDQVLRIPQLSDILPPKQNTTNQELPQTPMLAQATPAAAPMQETPLSRLEALMQQYRGEDQKSLEEARRRDRMLKVGGALGDALATYLNARSQMNVKAPGVQVQQGAGLGKIADMFATSGDVASDVKARRESLLKQYEELAKGERAKARLTSEEKREQNRLAAQEKARQETADLQRELTKARIEGGLKEAGIRASGKVGEPKTFTEKEKAFEERERTKARVKEEVQVNKENRQLKEKLEPALDTVNEQISNVENAIKLLNESKYVGTGPLDQYFSKLSPEGQMLREALGNIQLDTLVTKFQGMSRAIDTETDRKFFQETQPSMSNFETTNKKMLENILKRLKGVKERSQNKLKEISNSKQEQTQPESQKIRREIKQGDNIFDADTKEFIRKAP